jgi:hypothetical protein
VARQKANSYQFSTTNKLTPNKPLRGYSRGFAENRRIEAVRQRGCVGFAPLFMLSPPAAQCRKKRSMKTKQIAKLNSPNALRLPSGPATRNLRIFPAALALSALVFILSFLTTVKADSFINTGTMSSGRSGHTATLLLNGKVLVAAGSSTAPYLSSAEVYDPATETWTATGALSQGRDQHTATLLPNGKVLVAGGYSGDYSGSTLSSAEVYDPATGTWTATGALNTGRWLHAATLLPNGLVLVSGGYCGSECLTGTAEIYDPATGKWTPTGAMNQGRIAHTATVLSNGKVLVAAGYFASTGAELYDPATGTWTTTGTMSTARSWHKAVLLTSGQVLVVGSHPSPLSSTELYNPATGTWTATGALITSREFNTATLLPDGKVLVAGSRSGNDLGLSSAELYDAATGTWTATGALNTGRWGRTATLLPSGKVLMAGGWNGGPVLTAELYDSGLRITRQPVSQVGFWGKSVSFSVGVTNGTPPYSYQWLKDGVTVSDGTNSLLVLTNLQTTNAGVYTVVVSDAATTKLTSQPANLTVNPAGVSIALYAGVTIDGVVGYIYGIQMTTSLANTNSWEGVTNITLTVPMQLWYDLEPATRPTRYYRVVPGPIPVP